MMQVRYNTSVSYHYYGVMIRLVILLAFVVTSIALTSTKNCYTTIVAFTPIKYANNDARISHGRTSSSSSSLLSSLPFHQQCPIVTRIQHSKCCSHRSLPSLLLLQNICRGGGGDDSSSANKHSGASLSSKNNPKVSSSSSSSADYDYDDRHNQKLFLVPPRAGANKVSTKKKHNKLKQNDQQAQHDKVLIASNNNNNTRSSARTTSSSQTRYRNHAYDDKVECYDNNNTPTTNNAGASTTGTGVLLKTPSTDRLNTEIKNNLNALYCHIIQFLRRIKTLPTYFLKRTGLKEIDIAVAAVYMLSAIINNAPTVLLPVMAADETLLLRPESSSSSSSFAVQLTSISMLGGAFGKLVNGFICQSFGGRRCLLVYMTGLTLATLMLSCASSIKTVAISLTAMEYCHSILWTCCATILSNHHSSDNGAGLAKAITALSLGSTAGALMSKIGLATLLQICDENWRRVTQIAASFGIGSILVVLLCGGGKQQRIYNEMKLLFRQGRQTSADDNFFSRHGIHDTPHNNNDDRRTKSSESDSSIFQTMLYSAKSVFSTPIFWYVGICHSIAYLARGSDKILGSFLVDMTQLPRHVCGGLTSVLTIGFVYGLVRTQYQFQKLSEENNGDSTSSTTTSAVAISKRLLLKKRYRGMILSSLGLAFCSALFSNMSINTYLKALCILCCSMGLATNVSFQFYQFPSAVASFDQTLQNYRSVVLSFFDAMGFLVSAPIWAIVGKMVSSTSSLPSLMENHQSAESLASSSIIPSGGGVEGSSASSVLLSSPSLLFLRNGWTGAWLLLTILFGIGAKVALSENVVPQFMNVATSQNVVDADADATSKRKK